MSERVIRFLPRRLRVLIHYHLLRRVMEHAREEVEDFRRWHL